MLKKSQLGMSFWAILVLAPMVGLTVLTAIKLVPVYIEDAAVKSVLQTMSHEAEGFTTPSDVRGSFMKRIGINEVKAVTLDDVVVEREGSFYNVNVDYQARLPLFYNVSLLVDFTHNAQVPAL